MDSDCTTFELAASPLELAVLGIGSCERLSAHLPLCTDCFFAARKWNVDGRRPHLLLVDFFHGLSDTGVNLHAGEVETSLMLHLAPEKGRRDQAEDFVPDWGRQDLTHLGMKRISPCGVWGHPNRADHGKGERWFRQGVDYSWGGFAP